MKQKEKETKSNLSADELRAEIEKLEEKQFKLGFKHKVTPLGNPMELRQVRRDLARLKTWLRAKGLQTSTKE
jgi:large subunit ribosomal protein L29